MGNDDSAVNTRDTNTAVWEGLYRQGKSLMQYPDDIFVRVTHHLLDPEAHYQVLDFGFGAGANALHLLRRGFAVSGAEVSQVALDHTAALVANAGFTAPLYLLNPDGSIPFADQSFSTVVAWQVLYYNSLEGFSLSVAEIDRVLKPGGIAICALKAPGDHFQTTGRPRGDGVYELTVRGQEGAVVVIPERAQLSQLFPYADLQLGTYEYSFAARVNKNWIVTFRKPGTS